MDNPANEGAATPGGVLSEDLKAPNLQTASGQLGLIYFFVLFFFCCCCFFLLFFFLNHSGHVSF